MRQEIFNFISAYGLSPKMIILLLASLPVTELRASIPIGILLLKQGVVATMFFSILGNLIPVAPLYFFLEPLSRWLSRTRLMRVFFEWLYNRAQSKADLIARYELLGLVMFVAVPLPGTGAWTGTIIASILRLRFWQCFSCVGLGVILAAVAVVLLTLFGKMVF